MASASNNQETTESVIPTQPSASTLPPSEAAHPLTPEEVELHFDTPAWVRPGEGPLVSTISHIPSQPEPHHDRLPRPDDVPMEAHWVAHHGGRIVLGILFVATVLGTAAGAYWMLTQDAKELLPFLAVPAVLALAMWAVMVNTTPVVLDLKGSHLDIHQRTGVDSFDLADPDVVVATSHADDPEWAACFDRVDGSPITLTERQFDPAKLAPVLAYYRALAQRRMAERLERYQR